jgi:hypothetical protein
MMACFLELGVVYSPSSLCLDLVEYNINISRKDRFAINNLENKILSAYLAVLCEFVEFLSVHLCYIVRILVGIG